MRVGAKAITVRLKAGENHPLTFLQEQGIFFAVENA
jgi:hypothetical protein